MCFGVAIGSTLITTFGSQGLTYGIAVDDFYSIIILQESDKEMF